MLLPLHLNLDWEYADSVVVYFAQPCAADVTFIVTLDVEALFAVNPNVDVTFVPSAYDVNRHRT